MKKRKCSPPPHFLHPIQEKETAIPKWIVLIHVLFIIWVVVVSEYTAIFVASFPLLHRLPSSHKNSSVSDPASEAYADRSLPRRLGHPWRSSRMVGREFTSWIEPALGHGKRLFY